MVEMWSAIPYNVSLLDHVDMLVHPNHVVHVKSYLLCSGMTTTVLYRDLQRAIELENEPAPASESAIITRKTSK
jgi:hypothetical protein